MGGRADGGKLRNCCSGSGTVSTKQVLAQTDAFV